MATQLARIESIEDGRVWAPERYHRVSPEQLNYETRGWRVVRDKGIQVFGEKTVRRSPGEPTTLRKIRTTFSPHLREFGPLQEVALAVLANESRGQIVCERWEERIRDFSFGPAQFLTATAYGVLKEAGQRPPAVPVPKGGDAETWRRYLNNAENSVALLRIFLSRLDARFMLKQDPILLYAAYNAGSPRPSVSVNDWGLVVNSGDTLNKFAAWIGDAYATRPLPVA